MGELRYVAESTRPDIIFAVNKLATATHPPTRRHWLLLKALARYLITTKHVGILYKPDKNGISLSCFIQEKSLTKPHTETLTTFSDADFASDICDRKSTSGALHLFNNSPIEWTATKQTMQAL